MDETLFYIEISGWSLLIIVLLLVYFLNFFLIKLIGKCFNLPGEASLRAFMWFISPVSFVAILFLFFMVLIAMIVEYVLKPIEYLFKD